MLRQEAVRNLYTEFGQLERGTGSNPLTNPN